MKRHDSHTQDQQSRAAASSLGGGTFSFGNAPAQLKTVIKHTVGSLFVDGDNRTVGKKMEAYLDPEDEVVGSATGKNTDWMRSIRKSYPKANVVRGHLLNHDLGGYAIEENLYPISTRANADHSSKVEQKVKGQLTWANKVKGRHVEYNVRVNEVKSYEKAQFLCDWTAYHSDGQVAAQDKQPINSDLGTHTGGFGGGRKKEKSPPAWRHGKSKGGTEVKAVRSRLSKDMEAKRVLFSKEVVDHKGNDDKTRQDPVEWVYDLVEEYGALEVYEAFGRKLKSSNKEAPDYKLFVKLQNIVAGMPELVIEI